MLIHSAELNACYPAGAAAGSCILLVSVHLVKNSGNTSFSHTSLHPIPTKLGQSDRYLNHYSCTNNDGVKGQDGVTGVKKVIFTKKASSPTEYLASMRELCICISLTPSTKVMVLKIHPGSFGVTGVKNDWQDVQVIAEIDKLKELNRINIKWRIKCSHQI